MTHILDRLPIKRKIGANAAIILALLLLASGSGIVGLVLARGSVGEYRTLTQQTNAASTTQADMLQARVAVDEFIRT